MTCSQQRKENADKAKLIAGLLGMFMPRGSLEEESLDYLIGLVIDGKVEMRPTCSRTILGRKQK